MMFPAGVNRSAHGRNLFYRTMRGNMGEVACDVSPMSRLNFADSATAFRRS